MFLTTCTRVPPTDLQVRPRVFKGSLDDRPGRWHQVPVQRRHPLEEADLVEGEGSGGGLGPEEAVQEGEAVATEGLERGRGLFGARLGFGRGQELLKEAVSKY